MMRAFARLSILTLAIAIAPVVSFAQTAPAPAAAGAVTPADAKPFLGNWSVAGESQMGPFLVDVALTVEEGKVVGAISSDIQPLTPVTDITKSGANLVLRYSFSFDGNSIPAVLTLTPKEDKLDATFSFADGAFEMAGVGTKKAA